MSQVAIDKCKNPEATPKQGDEKVGWTRLSFRASGVLWLIGVVLKRPCGGIRGLNALFVGVRAHFSPGLMRTEVAERAGSASAQGYKRRPQR